MVLDIEDPKVRSQLINKAMKFGARFTAEDFADLDGELTPETYEALGKYAGFDHNDPYFDEDHMTWEDFYDGYSEWDKIILLQRLSKLKDFGPAEEVCEVIMDMPTDALGNMLYRKAGVAGVPFTREHLIQMGYWGDVLHDITTHELSDENIQKFVGKVKPVIEEAEKIIENQEVNELKIKRENRRILTLGAILGIFSGMEEQRRKRNRKK